MKIHEIVSDMYKDLKPRDQIALTVFYVATVALTAMAITEVVKKYNKKG